MTINLNKTINICWCLVFIQRTGCSNSGPFKRLIQLWLVMIILWLVKIIYFVKNQVTNFDLYLATAVLSWQWKPQRQANNSTSIILFINSIHVITRWYMYFKRDRITVPEVSISSTKQSIFPNSPLHEVFWLSECPKNRWNSGELRFSKRQSVSTAVHRRIYPISQVINQS